MTLDAAEGFANLGLWDEAWAAVESVEPAQRTCPSALRLQLRCSPGVGAWQTGEWIAGILRSRGILDRNAAATFYHAHARYLLTTGDRSAAASAMKAAVETWPDYEMALMLDHELGGEFEKVRTCP